MTSKTEAMKRILVPVDFSPLSRHAFDYALRMAAVLDADVVALHAFRIPSQVLLGGAEGEPWAEAEKERLGVLMDDFLADGRPPGFKRNGDPVRVETVLVEDYPEEGIPSFASRFACDLIVMGTQGAHELEGGGVGSMTTSFLHRSPVPVLIIPDGAEDRFPVHIVYAVDFQDGDRDTLRFLQALAYRFDCRLTVLHIREHAVFDQPAEYRNFQTTFHDLMEDDHCSFDLVRGVDLSETLRDYLDNREADWLVLRTRHHTEEGLTMESLTREMAWHAQIPLLVFPA